MAKALEIVYPPNSSSTFSKTSSTFPLKNYLDGAIAFTLYFFAFSKFIFAKAYLKFAKAKIFFCEGEILQE